MNREAIRIVSPIEGIIKNDLHLFFCEINVIIQEQVTLVLISMEGLQYSIKLQL